METPCTQQYSCCKWRLVAMVFEIRRVQMGEGKPFCLLCVYAPAVLEVNTTIQGLLQFSALIAAWDTHTNKQTSSPRPSSWAFVPLSRFKSHFAFSWFLLNAEADGGARAAERSAHCLREMEGEGGAGAHKLCIFQTMSTWAYGFRRI